VHGDQRIEETPRGIDGMICIVYGKDQRLCEMIGRLHVPDRIAVHPLTNDITKSTTTTLVDLALLGLLKLLLSSKSFSLCSSFDCLGFRFDVSDR
jgi:hypothetical protein